MKRLILIPLIIVLTVGLVLGGCAKPAPAPAPTPPPTPTPAPAPPPAPAPAPPTPAPAPPTPAPTPAPAPPKPIEIKFVAFAPPTPKISQVLIRFFRETEKRTDDRVKIVEFWGGSLLGAEAIYDGIVQGVADLGEIMPSYTKGSFPVATLLEQPWGYPDSFVVSAVAADVWEKYKPAELAHVHTLFAIGSSYVALASNKPVRTPEDFEGLKVRATGGNVAIVENLGGGAVSMPITEVYDAVRKGTVDAAWTGADTLESFKLAEVVSTVTDLRCVGSVLTNFRIMNLDKWNSLPPDIQQIITETAEEYRLIMCEEAYEGGNASAIELAKGLGVEIITPSPEEQARFAAAVKPIRDAYIDEMEAEGLPGKEMASFIEEAIKKHSQ